MVALTGAEEVLHLALASVTNLHLLLLIVLVYLSGNRSPLLVFEHILGLGKEVFEVLGGCVGSQSS